jgi:anti-sigma factor RsiW
VNCNDVAELIPAAVDGEIGQELLGSVNQHFEACPSCREEFELQQMTKRVLRNYFVRSAAPESTTGRIRQMIADERTKISASPGGKTPRSTIGFMWAAGFIAVAALLFIFITPSKSHHSHTQPHDGNIIHQVYNNFDGVLDGKVKPAIMTDDPQAVKAYFKPMVDFDVKVPIMRKYHLIGAVCSQYHHKCVAQLIYQGSQDMVYLYQVGCSSVLDQESGFTLPPETMKQISQSGWYVENHLPDCSLAIWIVDSTICCALADINKDVLMASLNEQQ